MIDRLDAILDALPGTRAEQITAAIRTLARDTAYAQMLLCELTWEAWRMKAWRKIQDPITGRPYTTRGASSEYFRQAWGGGKWSVQSIRLRAGLGRSIREFPVEQREWLRQELAALGIAKAILFITPVRRMRTAEALQPWLQQARLLTKRELDTVMQPVRQQRKTDYPDTRCPTCGKPRGRKALVTA